MKPSESAQVEFIKDRLRNGLSRKDILQDFAKSYKTSVKTFDNRLKIAMQAIKGESNLIKDKSEEYFSKKVIEQGLKLLSVAERQDILSKIAVGGIPLLKPNGTGKDLQMIEFVPDWMDRKNAIAELNKMGGDYAPSKTDITSGGKGIKSIIVERVRHNPNK